MACRGQHGECPNEPRKGGLCWGHVKARQDGRGIDIELKEPKGAARDRAGMPRRSLRAQLEDAAVEYANYDSEGDAEGCERVIERLRKAHDRAFKVRPATRPTEAPRRGRPPTGTSRWAAWRRRKGL